jgi:hypothetical protein
VQEERGLKKPACPNAAPGGRFPYVVGATPLESLHDQVDGLLGVAYGRQQLSSELPEDFFLGCVAPTRITGFPAFNAKATPDTVPAPERPQATTTWLDITLTLLRALPISVMMAHPRTWILGRATTVEFRRLSF